MKREPITVLIIGAGSRGRTVYGRYALEYPDTARVVAVAEPSEVRRQTLADEHELLKDSCFERWQDVPTDQRLGDVCVIATGDQDHVEPALKFLRMGYHVLLEKPMACDLQGCEKIVEAAQQASGMSAVCHVLRYTDYFRTLKSMIDEGLVGRVLTLRHLEPINFWHFAHSFVRGNWRNSQTSSPLILAKCCHDMDIIHYLMGETPVAVHSFGALSYFHSGSAPPQASRRCLDCSLQDDCTYSATRFYGDMLKAGSHHWPLDVVTQQFDDQALEQALRAGPYGRCVYHCDNDVCDHQVVNLQFESGATASLLTTAFTERPARQTEVMGSQGALSGDGSSIVYQDFATGQTCETRVESSGHHLGGDEAMLTEFFQAVREDDPSLLNTSPAQSLMSHRMALLAERSRTERTVVSIPKSFSVCVEEAK